MHRLTLLDVIRASTLFNSFKRWVSNHKSSELGSMIGALTATIYVISQSEGLTMADVFNLVFGNIEILLVVAGVCGWLLPKVSHAMFKGLWRFALIASQFVQFKPRAKKPLTIPEGAECVTEERGNKTVVTLIGNGIDVSETIKGYRKYAKRLRRTVAELVKRYHARAEVERSNRVWNPIKNWQSADGTIREIEELETGHLRNVVNMCKQGRSGLGERVIDVLLPKLEEELNSRKS